MADGAEQKSGTAGGGNAKAAGTPADGNAGTDETVQVTKAEWEKLQAEKSQHLAEKTNREREKQELEALRAAVQQPPTGPADDVATILQQEFAELQARAYQGDRNAMLQLAMINRQRMLEAELVQKTEMLQIPENDRQEVATIMQRHGIGSPSLAFRIVQGERSEKRMQELTAREAEVKRQQEEREKGVVGTFVRPNPQPKPGEASGSMTASDYGARMRDLVRAGKDVEADQLERDYLTGKITLDFSR